MIKLNVDLKSIKRELDKIAKKQVPYALSVALNETSKDITEDFKDHMQSEFKNPTRWTLNAFYVKRATKARLRAVVQRKTAQSRRHYLETQSKGGARGSTGLETLVRSRLKYSGHIESIVPARGAKLNKYGNWSPGQRNQVLSAIKSQRDGTSNTTAASMKRNRRRAGYFVPREGSKLSKGVWQRGSGNKIIKIAHFSNLRPRYKARVNFDNVAVKRFQSAMPRHFERALRAAMATAK